MHLKRLEIQGFKSFAKRTILEFLPPQDGRFSITAIVGPNGSGKSNVSDAIRWVMGEQSLKILRGKKSDDVIFNGSEAKTQLGGAEVSLVLDNTDGKTLSDYPEITVSRRFYRSGEGAYLINNNQVRLFDVRLLLAQAQFAENSYSVIGQGMIDRLLVSSPAERKDFLDEAAGIKEHQIKQHQAQLKLDRTRENIAQADRLKQEVEPRLKILAKQVKKLEKRQEVEGGLREAQEKYYAAVYGQNQHEWTRLTKELGQAEGEYRASFDVLSATQNELAQLARATSRQDAYASLQSAYQVAAQAKHEAERQLAVLSGQLQTEYRQAGKQDIGWLEEKIFVLQSGKEKLDADHNNATAQIEHLTRTAAAEERVAQELVDRKTDLLLQVSQLQTRLAQNQSEQHYREWSGLSAVKAVLDNRARLGKIHGLVAELGEVEDKYRQALEVAASSHLSSLVVADENVARLAIEFLRQQRLGVATFLPLNQIQGRVLTAEIEKVLQEKGVIGLATDLIKFSGQFKNIFSYIFGNTVVVEDLKAAQRIGVGRCRMVTLYGDLVERQGVMRGGWRKERAQLTFSRVALDDPELMAQYRADLTSLQQQLGEIEQNIDKARQSLLEAKVQTESAAARFKVQLESARRADEELSALRQELSLLKSSPAEYSQQAAQLQTEKERYEKMLEQARDRCASAEAEMSQFNEQEEQKKQRVFVLQDAMQKQQNAVNAILDQRNELKISLARLETKRDDLSAEVAREMGVSLAALAERSAAVLSEAEIAQAMDQIQKLKYQLSLIGGIDDGVAGEYAQTQERYDFLNGQLSDLSKAADDLETMIADLDELMRKKRSLALKQIRREFDRYFKILFSGGRADLEEVYGVAEPETDESLAGGEAVGVVSRSETIMVSQAVGQRKQEKVLCGIEVVANPPGKKIRHLNALSGGERTLASLALICAILSCNPSPFVVLDEVEAALDEANTQRFARIMAELSSKSQFIIITHNRVTMHAADALYGVVMGSDGASQLLSVKLNEAEVYTQAEDIDKNVEK